jgi:hypothetical protein
MSKKSIILLIYHRHKRLELINIVTVLKTRTSVVGQKLRNRKQMQGSDQDGLRETGCEGEVEMKLAGRSVQ